MEDSLSINRANWDERAPAHAASPGYAVDRFLADPSFISDVVRFDLPRLGDIAGFDGVHLQCHIGTDTVSLARLGARMTGLDFSPASVARGSPARGSHRAAGRVLRGERVRRPERPRSRAVRLRVHRHRRAVLAAQDPALGRGGGGASRARAAGCSSARAIRCCGRWTSVSATASWSSSRTSSARSQSCSTGAGRTSRPTSCSSTRSAIRGTTDWARSSPRCRRSGCG